MADSGIGDEGVVTLAKALVEAPRTLLTRLDLSRLGRGCQYRCRGVAANFSRSGGSQSFLSLLLTPTHAYASQGRSRQ